MEESVYAPCFFFPGQLPGKPRWDGDGEIKPPLHASDAANTVRREFGRKFCRRDRRVLCGLAAMLLSVRAL